MHSEIEKTVETLYGTGHWLVTQERYRDAMSVFRTMLVVDPRDERGWLALGTCHESVGDAARALSIFRLASDACDGKALRCTVARARMLRALGADDEALDVYEAAAELAQELGDDEMLDLVSREKAA